MDPGTFAAAYAAALPALQEAVAAAGNPSAAQADRLTAANAFAESVGELWTVAEALGPHLTELLAVIDGLVSGLPHRGEDSDAAGVAALEVMALLEAHLAEPHDPEIVTALLELTRVEPFDPPLSPAAAALWQACLEVDQTPPQDQEPAANAEPAAESAADATAAAPPELGTDARELLAILAAAVEDHAPDFLKRVEDLAQAHRAAERTAGAAAGRELLERFAEASAAVGFTAFASICAGLGEQLQTRNPRNPWPKSLIAELRRLPGCLLHYLSDPLAEAPRLALVATLANPRWPAPLAGARATELARALREEPLALATEPPPLRIAEVLDADLSLTPADDIDPGVLGSFRREGPDLAQRLASIIQVVRGGGAVEDALRQAQRYAHTLKGSANICGVRAVAFLGHHLEDLLEFLAEQALTPSPPLGEVLVGAADGLAAMFDAINGVEHHDPTEFRPVIQQVLDWACRIDQQGAAALAWNVPDSAPADAPAAAPAAPREPSVTLSAALEPAPVPVWTPKPASGATNLSAALEQAAIRPGGTLTEAEDAWLQVPARAVDALLRLVGELSLALSQSEEQLRQAARTLRESEDIDNRNLLQVSELEKLVDLRGLSGRGAGAARAFDPLELDQYDEMYIVARRINEGVADVRDLTRGLDGTITAMQELTRQQVKLSQELRQLTMGTRLVPMQSVVARLERAVRQTCRATGKEADLRVEGAEVHIDGDVLDRLMPALMHVVRNSIDHGIEAPAARLAAGKPAQGELVLTLRQSGDQIEVTFADDGAGLDLGRVRAKALAAGLLAPEANPSAQELILLTLRPGFSTRDQATQVSGRGVGMDVVANTVRLLNGALTIESETGLGYRLRARFPSSLATIHCLLIRCGDQPLALPANEVRLAVLAGEGEVRGGDGAWEFRHGEDRYPLVPFDTLLGRPAQAPDTGQGVVLIVPAEGGERAVLVDALHDCRELVVKKLGALIPSIPGLLAASILGDGRVVPIVELHGLMQIAASTEAATLAPAAITEPPTAPTILVVDDSLSMRRVLTQLVTDAGYRALTARDGMAAIQTLDREAVDLLLVDMEMPQMNGLELTAHLRARADTRGLPIGMITSRSTERHRSEALKAGVDRYFVKPYQEEEVLDFIHEALAAA